MLQIILSIVTITLLTLPLVTGILLVILQNLPEKARGRLARDGAYDILQGMASAGDVGIGLVLTLFILTFVF